MSREITVQSLKQLAQELRNAETSTVRWGVVAIAVILIWTLVLVPFSAWKSSRHEHLQMRIDRQVRLDALKNSSAEWNQAKRVYEAAFAKLSDSLFQTDGAVVSQGEIQTILRQLAEKNKLTLSNQASLEAVPFVELGVRLPVTAILSGNTNDVMNFIADIASHPKLLVLEQIQLSRQRENQMTLSIAVTGYLLGVGGE